MAQFTSLILRQILPRQAAIQKPLETGGLWSGPQFLFPVLPWVCFQASGSLCERETSGCRAGLGDPVRGEARTKAGAMALRSMWEPTQLRLILWDLCYLHSIPQMAQQMTPWKERGSCTGFGRQQIRRTEETVYPARTSQGTKWLWPYQGGREGAEPLGCGRRGGGRGRPRAWLGLEKECGLLPVGNCWLPTRELEGLWGDWSHRFRYQPLALLSK